MLGPAVIVAAAVALQQPAVPVVAVTAAIAAAVVSNSSRSRTNRTSTSAFRWLRLALFFRYACFSVQDHRGFVQTACQFEH